MASDQREKMRHDEDWFVELSDDNDFEDEGDEDDGLVHLGENEDDRTISVGIVGYCGR